MGMEKSLYDEMIAEKAEGVEMAYDAEDFKPLVAPGGSWHFDDPAEDMKKRVDELEHQMLQMVALFEELLNERERFETAHRLKSREGSFTPDFKAA
jgi:hypothetical protein